MYLFLPLSDKTPTFIRIIIDLFHAYTMPTQRSTKVDQPRLKEPGSKVTPRLSHTSVTSPGHWKKDPSAGVRVTTQNLGSKKNLLDRMGWQSILIVAVTNFVGLKTSSSCLKLPTFIEVQLVGGKVSVKDGQPGSSSQSPREAEEREPRE